MPIATAIHRAPFRFAHLAQRRERLRQRARSGVEAGPQHQFQRAVLQPVADTLWSCGNAGAAGKTAAGEYQGGIVGTGQERREAQGVVEQVIGIARTPVEERGEVIIESRK